MEIAEHNLDVKQKAQELVSLIKTRFVTEDGLLARSYPASKRTLFDNFDDIVPFFIFFDEADFLLSQIEIIRKKDKSMLDLCCEDKVLITRNIDEWFGGLYSLWKATGDKNTYELLKQSIDFVLEYMMKDGFLSAAYYRNHAKTAPFYESWSSGLLETFCEMRDDFPEAFSRAKRVIENWIQSDYFRRYHLFPYRVYLSPVTNVIQEKVLAKSFPLRRSGKSLSITGRGMKQIHKGILKKIIFYATNGLYSQLMKSNSTCAFAILEFYKTTGEKIWLESLIKWIESAIKSFCENGKVYMEFVPKTGTKRDAGVVPAFILADVLCDTVYFAGQAIPDKREKFLSIAKEIIDYHWRNRLENGLIPCNDGGDFAHIDHQVDFGLTLRRYAQLGPDDEYKKKSIELTQTVIARHYSSNGYFTYSGNKPGETIDPKYNALLLKGFINLVTIDKPLYPKYYGLFKDR